MKKLWQHSYLVFLLITCILIVPTTLVLQSCTTEEPETTVTTTETPIISTTEATTVTTTTVTTTTLPSATTTTQRPTTAKPVARSFPNTLFIGDSRTDGLRLYGKIQDATFFCVQSMSSFNTLKKELDVKGFGKTTLSNLLDKKQFETVYLMLGINELGYNLDTITSKYKEIVDAVKQKQPNAVVVVQATLHVTETKDKDNSVFTNARINDLNKRLATLVNEDVGIFFIDPNPAFDDANGNMHAEYSKDGVHYYGKYYPLWSEFLDNNRIVGATNQ